LQALGFGSRLGILQRDQCLSGTDGVAVRDKDFPDDAALKMLNRLAARLGFDGADSDRSALERGIGRPDTEANDKTANKQVSRPGDTAKPVAERRRRRSQPPWRLPDLGVCEYNLQTIPRPLSKEIGMLDVNPGDAAQPLAERWCFRSQPP